MIVKLLRAFDVPEPLVGDLVEERRRGRSRLWLWNQTAAAVLHAIAADIGADRWTAARTALAGAALLAVGAQLSLWLYQQATNHLPFQPWMATWWFVLAWHSYSVPLNILWCATAIGAGRIVARTDGRRRLSFVTLGLALQMPVLIWFARPAVQAAVRVTNPPTLLRLRLAFGVDVFVVMLVMPLCTLAAALKTRAVRK